MSSNQTNQHPEVSSRLQVLLSATLTLLLALFCCGCIIVPIRARTLTRGASTETNQKVSLDFIRSGVTTQQEVVQTLGWMDTGVNEKQLFVGRWCDSRWGVFWGAAGYYNAAMGWNRKWNQHNLLVEFDATGLAQHFQVVPDKQLAAALSSWAGKSQDNPLDLSTPIEVLTSVNRASRPDAPFTDRLLLGSDSFERHELQGKGKRKHDFSIPPSQIRSLSLSPWISGTGPDPGSMLLTFHFISKTPAGKKLTIGTKIPTVVLLFRYFDQTHRPGNAPPRP
jgi:hypothetical protein